MRNIIIPKSKLSEKSAVRKVVGDLMDRSGVQQLSEQEERDLVDKIFKEGKKNLTREEARGIIADVAFNDRNFRAADKLRRALGLRKPRRSDLLGTSEDKPSDRVEAIQMKKKFRLEQYAMKKEERRQKEARVAGEVNQNLSEGKRKRDREYLRGKIGKSSGRSASSASGTDVHPLPKPRLY